MSKQITVAQLKRAIKKEQKKATNPNSFWCKLGFHPDIVVAESGFIISYTEHRVCTRCGRYYAYQPCREY